MTDITILKEEIISVIKSTIVINNKGTGEKYAAEGIIKLLEKHNLINKVFTDAQIIEK